MHGFKPVVYFCKLIPMRDILVHLHFSLQVIWQGMVLKSALNIEVCRVDTDPRQYRGVLCALSLLQMQSLAKRVQ
jgi:hypothetical protein